MNVFINIVLLLAYITSLYFSVFLFLVFLDKIVLFKKEKSSLDIQKTPHISVIIPAHNEEKTILRTLKSVSDLDYPKNKLEVIVINDGSKDKTEEVIRNYIKGKFNFKLISHKNMGKAASMNKALKIAKGEFFACLDADSFVDSLTLKKMLFFYYQENDPLLVIVTPAMKVYQPSNLLQRVQWLEYLVIILIARIVSHLDSLYVAPGPFSLYRTSVIRKLGGFDKTSIVEDQEIAYRVQKENYKIKQCFDGYVYTVAPKKMKPFYLQRRRWYLGSIACVHKYRDLIANKKYGDFGMMQMIKNVAGYVLALTGIILALYIFVGPFFTKMKNLAIIKFNILPYFLNFKFNITFLDLLLIDFKRGFIIFFLFALGTFFFYQAHKNANEKVNAFGWLPLIPYFAFYYLVKGVILLLSLFEFARGKKLKW